MLFHRESASDKIPVQSGKVGTLNRQKRVFYTTQRVEKERNKGNCAPTNGNMPRIFTQYYLNLILSTNLESSQACSTPPTVCVPLPHRRSMRHILVQPT